MPGLQISVHNWKLFCLFLNQNICCGYSKEPSRWDKSFEHPKHMFRLLGKKIIAILRSKILLNWTYIMLYFIAVRGQIRTTIGQAMLLMDQRFKQFSGLVDNCEFSTSEKETTCTDLQGFWDMVYFQVCMRTPPPPPPPPQIVSDYAIYHERAVSVAGLNRDLNFECITEK